MIWAFHDVNPNTDSTKLFRMISALRIRFPHAGIMCGITLLAGKADHGGLYQDMPIGHKPWTELLCVDSGRRRFDGICKLARMNVEPSVEVVSHGLVHVQHAALHIDAQRMSIVASCQWLGADAFIPPFDSYNADTMKVCEEHGITLEPVRKNAWHCLERYPFDPSHDRWHCHPWKWTAEKFEETINVA